MKIRVIPIISVRNFGVVKTVEFDVYRPLGVATNFARVYNARGVDELIVVDIDATKEHRGPDLEYIRDISEECFMPLTVGGGITRLDDVKALIQNGADKVAMNTAALERPAIIEEVAKAFGSQCIVVSIDAFKNPDGSYTVRKRGGKIDADKDLVSWISEVQDRGAGEILITSINQDGKMAGYDLELIAKTASICRIPVICAGGAGSLKDFSPAVKAGANAIACSSIFHYTEVTPNAIKQTLAADGISVRLI